MSITMERYNQIVDHLYKKCFEGEISVNQREHLLTKAKNEIDGSHLFKNKITIESVDDTIYADFFEEKDKIYQEWADGLITLHEREDRILEARGKYISEIHRSNELKTIVEKALSKEEFDDNEWYLMDIDYHGAKIYSTHVSDTSSKEYKRFLSDYGTLDLYYNDIRKIADKAHKLRTVFRPSFPVELRYFINEKENFGYFSIEFNTKTVMIVIIEDKNHIRICLAK
jgi:hypothetical protein